jgi:hypothetical protein
LIKDVNAFSLYKSGIIKSAISIFYVPSEKLNTTFEPSGAMANI